MILKTQFISENYAEKLSSTLLSKNGSGISNLVGYGLQNTNALVFALLMIISLFKAHAVLNVAKLLILLAIRVFCAS